MPLERVFLDVALLSPDTYAAGLRALPPESRTKVVRYHFAADRRLSLGSALLQRWLLCRHYAPYSSLALVPIHIDPQSGRPSHAAPAAPEPGLLRSGYGAVLDYNASHHRPTVAGQRCVVAMGALTATAAAAAAGHQDVSAAGPEQARIGVDVVPTTYDRGGNAQDFVDNYCSSSAGVFTAHEVVTITAHVSLADRVRCLYLVWALKEAYTKATGTGVVTDLTRIEFRRVTLFDPRRRWRDAQLWIDGVDRSPAWYFEVTFLPIVPGDGADGGGGGDGIYLAVCAPRAALTEDDMAGDWRALDVDRDILQPWGGGVA